MPLPIFHYFELIKVTVAYGLVGGPSPSFPCVSLQPACLPLCLCVCVSVCVCSRLVSWQKHAETVFLEVLFLAVLFQNPGRLAAISLKGPCFWPIVLGKLSLIAGQFLPLSLSLSLPAAATSKSRDSGIWGEKTVERPQSQKGPFS